VIAAIIVTYKETEATHRCVASVLRAAPRPDVIVLVDNASPGDAADRHEAWLPALGLPARVIRGEPSDADAAWLRERRDQPVVVLLRSAINTGFAGGVNAGWRVARTCPDLEAVLLLNNDAAVDPGFLAPLADALAEPGVGLATGTIHHLPRRAAAWYAGGTFKWWQCRGHHDSAVPPAGRDVTFATGCLMLVRAEVMERLGGMPALYFLYYEDVEFSLRIRRLGYRLRYEPASVVFHEVGVSTGHRSFAPRTAFVSARNRLWVARRNLPLMQRVIATLNILADETGRLLGAVARGRGGVARAILQGLSAGLFTRADDRTGERQAARLRAAYAAPMTDA
jgi:GT2 family glycosyltransferase